MKKILLIVACALLSPMHLLEAAQEARSATRTTARKTTAKKPAIGKAGTKKTGATHKTAAVKSKAPRVKTTTAGSKTTKTAAAKTKKAKPAAKKTTVSSSKKTTAARTKTTAARTKTTTAGTKAKAAKKSPKTTKATPTSRAQKTTYSTKPATKKTATKKAASKKATDAQQPKRVYRKGGVTYRHFNHLNNMVPQQLGAITQPVTQNVVLNKPGRGYVNANLINFTTPDGKEGQVVLDTHTISAARAERKGFGLNTHGKKSVEVFAGSDAVGKGLALIGEYPLKSDNVQISVDPSGHVTLNGADKPVEFSIHQ